MMAIVFTDISLTALLSDFVIGDIKRHNLQLGCAFP
jgi:hypothetical protein